MSIEMNVMHSSLFDAVCANSFFYPIRTVYFDSASELEEKKRNKREKNSKILWHLVKGWKRIIKLDSRCLMNVSMNYKNRSKLLLLLRRSKKSHYLVNMVSR